MEKLLFDLGNSRIKFSSICDGQYTYHGAYNVETFLENIEEYLFDEFDIPDNVFIVSVASSKILEQFRNQFFQHWGIIPTKLESQETFSGLDSAYTDFSALGDDRWYAMIGAHAQSKDPLLVIDAGTALTIDGVFEGKHIGGMIVPGLRLQQQSLFSSTGKLKQLAEQQQTESQSLLATNTFDAIQSGTVYMVSSYLNSVIADLNSELQTRLRIFLTGGDAKVLESLIDSPVTLTEDLVIKGMKYKIDLIEEKSKKMFDARN